MSWSIFSVLLILTLLYKLGILEHNISHSFTAIDKWGKFVLLLVCFYQQFSYVLKMQRETPRNPHFWAYVKKLYYLLILQAKSFKDQNLFSKLWKGSHHLYYNTFPNVAVKCLVLGHWSMVRNKQRLFQ